MHWEGGMTVGFGMSVVGIHFDWTLIWISGCLMMVFAWLDIVVDGK